MKRTIPVLPVISVDSRECTNIVQKNTVQKIKTYTLSYHVSLLWIACTNFASQPLPIYQNSIVTGLQNKYRTSRDIEAQNV